MPVFVERPPLVGCSLERRAIDNYNTGPWCNAYSPRHWCCTLPAHHEGGIHVAVGGRGTYSERLLVIDKWLSERNR